MMRSHTCGELRAEHAGQRVTLCGWVQHRRDMSGVLFLILRDRYGITQASVEPDAPPAVRASAEPVRLEWVVRVTGTVRARPEGQANVDMPTGAVELVVEELEVLNASKPLPVAVSGAERTSENLALQYRYLEMRRPELRSALETRARANQVIREFMIDSEFVEIETPCLLKSTPEGARDYLVPSRIHPGQFYALPQSPQILKQLCMVGGFDRYWQIVRCFRDEDLRADRQPEFTQLDVEMSFVTPEDVQLIAEGLMVRLLKEVVGVDVQAPFPHLSCAEAEERYGTDKPDLRFELPVHDVSKAVENCEFGVFTGAIAAGGVVRALAVPASCSMSRKQLDALPAVVADRGAKGVAWCRVEADDWKGPASRFLQESDRAALVAATGVEDGGILLFLAGPREVAVPASGDLRDHLAELHGLISPGAFAFCWIDEFPMFERDEESGRLVARHHPFTAPLPEHNDRLESAPETISAQAYDLVLNGFELLGGSIRIHQSELQRRVLAAIGMDEEEASSRFGFLIDALDYGAPPMGGFAMGTDRLVAVLLGLSHIRDVIAFPKTTSAADLMCGSPSQVDPAQLAELGLAITAK